MITLCELMLTHHMENRWITLETGRMQLYIVKKVSDACEASLRIFERDASNQTVELVTERQQMFGEITAVLPSDAGDKSSFNQRRAGASSTHEAWPSAFILPSIEGPIFGSSPAYQRSGVHPAKRAISTM